MNSKQLATLGLLGAALISGIIALATPGWLFIGANASCGLFACTGRSAPIAFVQGTAEKVTCAFLIVATIGLLAAMYFLYRSFNEEGDAIMKKRGQWTSLGSALFILIAMATYTGILHSIYGLVALPWGYSYVLGWVALGLALLGGIAPKYLET